MERDKKELIYLNKYSSFVIDVENTKNSDIEEETLIPIIRKEKNFK